MKFLFEKSRADSYIDNECMHSCYELVYCRQGTGYFCFNNVNIPFKSGMYVVFPPSSVISESGNLTVCDYLGFEYEYPGELSCGLFEDDRGNILKIIELMQCELKKHTDHSDKCLESYLKILIYTIKRESENSLTPLSQHNSNLISEIKSYFDRNYDKPINVSEYFASIGYSYHHLRHSFKEVCGFSPNQYLMNVRIEAAKRLLLSTDYTLEEIYRKCGFNSVSHFVANFKKSTNKTPTEFREERG